MNDAWTWTAATTAEHIAEGEISALEVAEAHLARIDAVNGVINAVVDDVADDALRAARACDDAQAAGTSLGPLHGVPVTIKENIDVEGQPTPGGWVGAADVIATRDSPLVAHMKAAGAVIVARTATPELSLRWYTDSPLRGATRNPWSAARTPGGSSGGAAAALVAGVGTIAHGNDLGGSIRQPANCCGLAGLRPSLGRIATYNPSANERRSMALQLMSVQGPLGRTVDDVRLGLQVMSGPSPDDPWHRRAATPIAAAGAPRAAVTYGVGPIDDEVRAAVDAAAAALVAAGYDVRHVDPPHLVEIAAGWRTILSTETAATLDLDAMDGISDDLHRVVGWMLDGHETDLPGLIDAYAGRLEHLRSWTRFLAEHQLVVAPVSLRAPFAPNADAASRESFEEILAGHVLLVAGNYLGLPAAAVPSVLTADGPIGVQVFGAPFDDANCLDAAAAIESGVGVMAERLWAGHEGALV